MQCFKMGFIISGLLFTQLAWATIINVPADQPTIQAGINVAANGDTVLVEPGVYVENITINHSIVLGSFFITTGDTSYISQTVIDGNQYGSVVKFFCSGVLSGLTLRNGDAWEGGGINISESWGHVILSGLIITDNQAMYGGGIYSSFGGSFSLSNSAVSNNEAGEGGGICLYEDCFAELENVLINNCTAIYGGGMYVFWHASPHLYNVTLVNNAATNECGIWLYYADLFIYNSILWNNGEYGILYDEIWEYGNVIEIECTDLGGGIYEIDEIPIPNRWTHCFIADPLFCDPDNGNYFLDDNSPCLPGNHPNGADCGLIGAFEQGCTDAYDQVGDFDFALSQNYPNPFNPTTQIVFTISDPVDVSLIVYDLRGRLVATLVDGPQPVGQHEVTFNGCDLASGVYYYQLITGDQQLTRKMLLVR